MIDTIMMWLGIIMVGFFGLAIVSAILFTIIILIINMLRRMTVHSRQRKAILQSLAESERNVFGSRESLYEQYVNLGYGMKNAKESKLSLAEYEERIIVEYNKISTNSYLERSKDAYMSKYREAIKKSSKNESLDLAGFNHVDADLVHLTRRLNRFNSWDLNL